MGFDIARVDEPDVGFDIRLNRPPDDDIMDWEPVGAAEPNMDPNTGEILNPGAPLEWRRRRMQPEPAIGIIPDRPQIIPDIGLREYDSETESSDDEPVAD